MIVTIFQMSLKRNGLKFHYFKCSHQDSYWDFSVSQCHPDWSDPECIKDPVSLKFIQTDTLLMTQPDFLLNWFQCTLRSKNNAERTKCKLKKSRTSSICTGGHLEQLCLRDKAARVPWLCNLTGECPGYLLWIASFWECPRLFKVINKYISINWWRNKMWCIHKM